jgi:hypothetical protein
MLAALQIQPCMHSVETGVHSMSVQGEPFLVKSRLVRTTRTGVSPQTGVNSSVRGEPSDPQSRPSVRTAGEAYDPIIRGPLVALLSSCNDIKEVWFNVPGMSDHQILLPGVRAHTLELTPTNPAIITHLSPKTKTFRINSTVASAQPESLWILLDAILSQETHLSSLIVYGDGFNWMSYRNARGELPAGTSIIPDLLRYAAKLSAKGIPLKDSKGKTVTDYFTSL